MNMKDHILAALNEQFVSWEELLAGSSEEQITTPRFDLDWSVKDVLAHLWAWQQISIARMEGGLNDREPELPGWISEIENWEENADQVNSVTYKTNHEKSWSEVHKMWGEGFLRFLELGAQISEKDLLDGDRFHWLNGYNLAFVLIASYDHHQEHLEKVRTTL